MSPRSGVRFAPSLDARTRRRTALVALLVASLIALVWVVWPQRDLLPPEAPEAIKPPAAQKVVKGSSLKPAACGRPATKPFVPTRISVDQVATNAEVLALPRDANDVPQAPPLSSAGKRQFAWDAPTLKPGSPRGNVLINAHTYPDGSALGNLLMEHLQVGERIIVRGANGAELCYRVTKRVVIEAAAGSWEYYEQDGPPQIALIVCTGPRLGPGNWKNRTIWYASPINANGTV